jgi:hypothetical protein
MSRRFSGITEKPARWPIDQEPLSRHEAGVGKRRTPFFNLLTEAAEIPASLATSRTPFPAASPALAFSTLVTGMGGRPNLIDAARAAACPRKILSRRFWRNW